MKRNVLPNLYCKKLRNFFQTASHIIRTFLPAVAVAAALVGSIAFLVWGSTIKQKLDEEVFKISYQFLLIVVLGGAVSFMYNRITEQRDLERKQKAQLREFHDELLKAFNSAKRARRILSANRQRSVSDPGSPRYFLYKEKYEEQLLLINDAQLTFEVFAKRAKNTALWFSGGDKLADRLSKIEKYLNRIINEYEDKLMLFDGNPNQLPLTELPRLSEYIAPYDKKSQFAQEFKFPFREALDDLIEAGLQ